MAKAIFHKDAEIRSTKHNVAWSIKASPKPQTFPRECIELAVAKGVAEIVPPRRKASEESEQESGE